MGGRLFANQDDFQTICDMPLFFLCEGCLMFLLFVAQPQLSLVGTHWACCSCVLLSAERVWPCATLPSTAQSMKTQSP